MLFSFFYNLALFFLALLALPKLLYQLIFLKKYRSSFAQRFGFHFPQIDKGNQKLVWIHAVSVGETKAIAALAKLIKDSGAILLISSITETGHAEAKRSIPFADYFVFLPFDFSWIIKPIVKGVKPDLVICSETDIWYNFLKSAKKNKASNILVNGKISERSFKGLQVFSFFSKKLFGLLDLLAVQNEEYKQRFEQLGVNPNLLNVTGNLKLDEKIEINSTDTIIDTLGLTKEDFVIVLGSTHAPEEKLILKKLQTLFHTYPKIKILVVPRHPERFDSVASIIAAHDPDYGRLSRGTTGKIILIDTMGLLKSCLQIANLAIIGGSFVPGIGGHNITEPAQYGVPVLFGPFMHNQPDFPEIILKNRAGEQITLDQLSHTVQNLFENPQKLQKMGLEGKNLLTRMQGSTQATWCLLTPFLTKS